MPYICTAKQSNTEHRNKCGMKQDKRHKSRLLL